MKIAAQKRNLNMTLEVPPVLPPLAGDDSRVGQRRPPPPQNKAAGPSGRLPASRNKLAGGNTCRRKIFDIAAPVAVLHLNPLFKDDIAGSLQLSDYRPAIRFRQVLVSIPVIV